MTGLVAMAKVVKMMGIVVDNVVKMTGLMFVTHVRNDGFVCYGQ